MPPSKTPSKPSPTHTTQGTSQEAETSSTLSFEQAMEKIQTITQELEQGQLPLNETLKRYEEAVKWTQWCQKELEQAKQKIHELTLPSES